MLFDTHAHLDQAQFAQDSEQVLERAQAAGVTGVLAVAVSAESSAACVALAQRHSGVWASVGIHPTYCLEVQPGDWDRVVRLAQEKRVVALGETGLDNYWKETPLELQRDYFARHLQLSAETGLPFIVHLRESETEVLAMLREAYRRGPLSGVMHSFTCGAVTAAECVAMGLHISFAGMVTYKKSVELREVARTIPSDRILVETDSPYLAPEPVRGKRNEPANVVHTARVLAEARGEEFATFATQTTANARRLFRLE